MVPYEVKFFYGRPITERDIAILVGHPSMVLEEIWRDYRYNYDVIYEIAELFKAPVRVELVWNASEDERFDPYLIIDRIYEPIWDNDLQNHARFQLQLHQAEWDHQLRGACDEQGIPWQQPRFHLALDYGDLEDYRGGFAYYGAFFYGLEVLDVAALIRKLLNTEQVPWNYRGTFDSEDASDWLFRWAEMRELFDLVNNLWEQAGNPFRIGFIPIQNRGIAYLTIRSTFHSADDHHPITPFDIPEQNCKEWDRLLIEKCTAYGLEYAAPTFHTTIVDCFYSY